MGLAPDTDEVSRAGKGALVVPGEHEGGQPLGENSEEWLCGGFRERHIG